LDPGSGKKSSRIPDPGGKKASDPGSGSATLCHIAQKHDFVLCGIAHYRDSALYKREKAVNPNLKKTCRNATVIKKSFPIGFAEPPHFYVAPAVGKN
jgi:hypothetical protein